MAKDEATRPQPAELLAPMRELAHAAGERIMAVYQRDFGVATKADDSPLTEADRDAHACLSAGLAKLAPALPILSEEGTHAAFEERRNWHYYWLIDPLDGTREFIKKNGEFTVNIALMAAGRPMAGVVHAPAQGRSWCGIPGETAFREDATGRHRISTRTLPEQDPMIAVVSRSHRGAAVEGLLRRLPRHETTSIGSSLKFCLVAQGGADLYPRFGPTSEWDTAAAQAVVEAAGGRVLRLDLRPLAYNTKDSLLNPDFVVIGDPHQEWTERLAGFPVNER